MKLMKTPKSLDLAITNYCNLQCTYCSHFTSAGETDYDLPKDEWLRFFEELNHCAVLRVTIEGGEPFLRKDIREIIEGITRNRMRFSVLSNGTLITEDMSAFLASTRRCDHVQISIDGSCPEIHDTCRGKGNFQKAVRGIQYLQRHEVPVAVRVTIHRHNADDLEKIAKLLIEDLGLNGFSTNSASYMGRCREYADDVQLTIGQRSHAMETLLKLDKKYKGRISANAGPLTEAKNWMEMEQAHRQGRESLPGRGYLTACGGVMSKMAIRADGVMVPCNQMSHIELGKINRDNLKDIWQNHPELNRLRKRRKIPLSEFDFCKDCVYIPYCTGNCPALAYTLTGREDHPSPDACLKRFLEAGGRLPDVN